MKITIEINNEEEFKRAKQFIRYLTPASLRTKYTDQVERITKFLAFVRKHTVSVKKIQIPSREERNAR